MTTAVVLTAVAFFSPWLPQITAGPNEIVRLWVACSLVSTLWLLLSVGRLAKHRFFSPTDIDGGGLNKNTAEAASLQALLQNTLEQTVLAVIAYGAWAFLAQPARLGLLIVFTCFFAIGRLLFFVGYSSGAPARALGFGLTFYPSAALLLGSTPAALAELITP